MSEWAVITCAVTGVLTDPARHPVPVTVEEMARACGEARDAGASVVHLHFRQQDAGRGHLPTWEPETCARITRAIRDECPGILVNMSTGVVGPDVSGPVGALPAVRPEIAALNAGSLNYLKTRRDGRWAWPPILFDNPVDKVERMLTAIRSVGAVPEFECFDTGIVRSVGLFVHHGMVTAPHVNFVMGVASGQPADPELLPILLRQLPPDATWEVTAIGRREVWELHRRAAELGGALRTGLEDTFYLPDGTAASGNGPLVEALVKLAEDAGRKIAGPEQARRLLGVSS
ncbi:MAG TPA: 3-keto-5-aminohexanoate cleavage protein [Myxococcales bacterium LLY-WYZ-16_1]|nr:3-keto-5-aminohexanoate cleavage protein [Myxococcales bacterium LLY-WYZ-16_1]